MPGTQLQSPAGHLDHVIWGVRSPGGWGSKDGQKQPVSLHKDGWTLGPQVMMCILLGAAAGHQVPRGWRPKQNVLLFGRGDGHMMVADSTFSCVYLPKSPSWYLYCVISEWGSCLFQRVVTCLGALLCGVLVRLHVLGPGSL